ncbi:hypothetical protein RRG08_001203 [Elysia crispata]|uniref:Uncharacterized protein n=1 Tax=Elysia crispata TaxID=231223 RepID=A0AAE1EBV2_9GAST|nr:hypothetical protein RRG08_001203 [Elysia crispata]
MFRRIYQPNAIAPPRLNGMVQDEIQTKEVSQSLSDERAGIICSKVVVKAEGKEKRDMFINEMRVNEDSRTVQKAVQQPQEGQWNNALQKSLTWNEVWHMETFRTSFLIRSVYNFLPSNANLVLWGKNRTSLVRYDKAGKPQSMS